MKFFLPDSQDLVDPSFDFESERRSVERVRQRDDAYAHEVFAARAFDGFLVSKGIVDGFGATGSRYTLAQRHRLLREGARDFLRVEKCAWGELPIMGDCGAFTYVKEKEPPYTVDAVLEFYGACDFDLAISVDHVILAYQPAWDDPSGPGAPPEMRERQELTLAYANEFLQKSKNFRFEPLGVAQGWSPKSYANAVGALQKMGYKYIALGGMVPLKTHEILASLEVINQVRDPEVRLHLLGVTRLDRIPDFAKFGVASFDSTSPLRQAFKDDKDNYHTMGGTYCAVRVPQIEGNPDLLRKITAGKIPQDKARKLERASLEALKAYDARQRTVREVVEVLQEYEALYNPGKDHGPVYTRVLEDRPWEKCDCDVCKKLRYHVILFRGAERNRRRGFHNIWVFYRRLHRELAGGAPVSAEPNGPTNQLALL